MKILYFPEVSSTQDIAKAKIANREEICVWAERQKTGRGRFERVWHSPPGGLYFSLLLFPKPKEVGVIHLKLFWSVVKGIEAITGFLPSFKWPNDIFGEGKKLGGILLERVREAIIAGCGLNVNNEEFPPDIKNAISLRSILKREIPIDQLQQSILEHFQRPVFFPTIIAQLRKINFLKEKYIVVNTTIQRIEGIAEDIDEEGRLLLRTRSGRLLALNSGEVEKVDSM